jgi:hypothetical protein
MKVVKTEDVIQSMGYNWSNEWLVLCTATMGRRVKFCKEEKLSKQYSKESITIYQLINKQMASLHGFLHHTLH